MITRNHSRFPFLAVATALAVVGCGGSDSIDSTPDPGIAGNYQGTYSSVSVASPEAEPATGTVTLTIDASGNVTGTTSSQEAEGQPTIGTVSGVVTSSGAFRGVVTYPVEELGTLTTTLSGTLARPTSGTMTATLVQVYANTGIPNVNVTFALNRR
jgi:hypothetical protein